MGFLKIQFVAKYEQKLKEGPFGDIKKFEKVSQSRVESLIVPKKWKGTLLGFVFQVGGFWMRTEYFWKKCIMRKKWYIQGEVFGLTKKKRNKTGTSKIGAISKAQEAQSFLNMLRTYS